MVIIRADGADDGDGDKKYNVMMIMIMVMMSGMLSIMLFNIQ